jgi:hypothetical protein
MFVNIFFLNKIFTNISLALLDLEELRLAERFPLPPLAMDFLVARPQMTFSGAGAGTSFAADIFGGRPSFEEIQGFQGIMDEIAIEVQASMQRPSCRISSVDLIIDSEGLFGIFVFEQALNTGNAKRAVNTLRAGEPSPLRLP